jgi:hypothetical protein
MVRWFSPFGVALQLIGAVVLAWGLFISPEEAVELTASRFAGTTLEQNIQAPAARDRLRQSRDA